MDSNSLYNQYRNLFPDLQRFSRAENIISEGNVYQQANPEIRKIMDMLCNENMNDDSEFQES